MAEPSNFSAIQPLAWVTGANGLIGSYLLAIASRHAPGWRVRAITRADFDLLDAAAVEREFLRDRPQLVIHCAAITVVSDAHKNPDLARRVNVGVTRHLAQLAEQIPFVFFSTDIVFDGRQGDYVETDPVNPIHVYGETKAVAEQVVLRNPRHLVVRTSVNAGISAGGSRSFNEQMHRSLLSAGQGMKLFTDEFRCPIPAVETARAVWELALKRAAGIYHVAGAKKLSRYDIGRLLAARWPDVTTAIEAGLAKEFPGPPRVLDASLNISKVQSVLSAPLPGFDEWLAANPGERV